MNTLIWIVNFLDKHSGASTTFSTLVLILVTMFYAYEAKKQTDEARESRNLQKEVFIHQKEMEDKNILEKIKSSARILYTDLFTALRVVILYGDGSKDNLEYIYVNSEYAKYLANLSTSLVMEDMIKINKLYAMIEDYSSSLLRKNEEVSIPISKIKGIYLQLFGENKYPLHEHLIQKWLSDNESVIEEMRDNYKEVFKKLKGLL